MWPDIPKDQKAWHEMEQHILNIEFHSNHPKITSELYFFQIINQHNLNVIWLKLPDIATWKIETFFNTHWRHIIWTLGINQPKKKNHIFCDYQPILLKTLIIFHYSYYTKTLFRSLLFFLNYGFHSKYYAKSIVKYCCALTNCMCYKKMFHTKFVMRTGRLWN